MKSALTLWANLKAARDDSSMNLSYEHYVKCRGPKYFVYVKTKMEHSGALLLPFN